MKTMTCRDMGGPCDAAIHGNTAEEMISSGRDHVHSMDDDGHKQVMTMMEEMQSNPEAAKQWNDKFSADFDALPES